MYCLLTLPLLMLAVVQSVWRGGRGGVVLVSLLNWESIVFLLCCIACSQSGFQSRTKFLCIFLSKRLLRRFSKLTFIATSEANREKSTATKNAAVRLSLPRKSRVFM
uniref:Putative secreted protein n=1 Tax=Rhipicephalus microplus TaxID=6941 RepID=A0A6M2D9L7_RHIMP